MDWRLHPYPNAKSFGFTIVHDADSAYSLRLAPIIDAFDDLGLRTTITVFPFWAEWGHPIRSWREWREQDPFFAPIAVPLVDDAERAFYLDVAARGHEIALHSTSETSSLRSEVPRAFAYFEEVFGHPAKVYVEHSPGNNLDTQRREGSNPESPYYNTDLLNQSGAWIWVNDPETAFPAAPNRLDVRKPADGPFCPRAREKFGIERAFMRSRAKSSDGDGFLEAFTPQDFDQIERCAGLVLLYTHLDFGWLDAGTRALREDIRARLADVAGRNVWFAPAGEILDRFACLRDVGLEVHSDRLTLSNQGHADVVGLTLIAPNGLTLAEGDQIYPVTPEGRIVIGTLPAQERRAFPIVPLQDKCPMKA